MEKTRCCKMRMVEGSSFRRAQCSRVAKVMTDGKPYCTQHDPQRRQAEAKARADAHDRERTARYAAQDQLQRDLRRGKVAPALAQALIDMLELREASMRQELHPKGELEIVSAAWSAVEEYRGLAP